MSQNWLDRQHEEGRVRRREQREADMAEVDRRARERNAARAAGRGRRSI